MCRITRRDESRGEVLALAQPQATALDLDLKEYISRTRLEVNQLACASAFRLGCPDHLCDSNFLRISCKFDERPTLLRQRFELFAIGLFRLDDAGPSTQPFRDVLPAIRAAKERESKRAGSAVMMLLYEATHHSGSPRARFRTSPAHQL